MQGISSPTHRAHPTLLLLHCIGQKCYKPSTDPREEEIINILVVVTAKSQLKDNGLWLLSFVSVSQNEKSQARCREQDQRAEAHSGKQQPHDRNCSIY